LAAAVRRAVERNVQLQDVVERLVAERKVLHERLITEHSKVEFFQSCKEGAVRKLNKELTETRAQLRHAHEASDVLQGLLDTERRDKEQVLDDLEIYEGELAEQQRQVEMWTALQVDTVLYNGLLHEQVAKLETEVATLKDFIKLKDEQWELCKHEVQELETKSRFFEQELMDVGMENAKLRDLLSKSEARAAKHKAARRREFESGAKTILDQMGEIGTLKTEISDLKKRASFVKPQRAFAKRSHPVFPENRKREIFARPENVISPPRLKRAKAIVGAALAAEVNQF